MANTCLGCKYVEWLLTKNGRLHPCGQGKCKYPYKVPELPAAFIWSGWMNGPPSPNGGYVQRKEEFKNPCPYWTSSE